MKKLILGLVSGWLAFQAQAAGEVTWLTDMAAAQKKAKEEKKMILMDFTGSDWCGWCIKLNKEVFSTKEFADYAKDNLVLVEVDFPRKKKLSDEQKKANDALQSKYGAEGFPTIVVLNSEGKQVWKQVGYMPGGPKAWIAKLDEAKGKKTASLK
jgi:protein disulfide-isomerase